MSVGGCLLGLCFKYFCFLLNSFQVVFILGIFAGCIQSADCFLLERFDARWRCEAGQVSTGTLGWSTASHLLERSRVSAPPRLCPYRSSWPGAHNLLPSYTRIADFVGGTKTFHYGPAAI